jgi:D-alanyl-D-alanine carboxypeptidase
VQTLSNKAGGAVLAGSLIGQFGSVPGYLTGVFSDPKSGLTVAVALNNSAASEAIGAYLAWQLAAIASKAPAASGETAPEAGLPWTAQQYHDAIAKAAVCPLPK